ncbi:MAG TPA: DUF255 domain-containing protein [Chthoniobacterales bacterium]|nr:DUF255 domain-containing protein [Chthoniobacterales bacterium]
MEKPNYCPVKSLCSATAKADAFFRAARTFSIVVLFLSLASGIGAEEQKIPQIDWQPWSESIFEKARQENRFVLLDLGAVWCHWCHVMEDITYRDPKVISLIKSRYIAVRVDQDSRPDLASRYEDYGWPATIVFNTDGSEIVKRQGYIPPKPMASLLQAIIDDPSPGPSIVAEPPLDPNKDGDLTEPERTRLREILRDNYDARNQGWGTIHKYLSWDIIEYCCGEAVSGDRDAERMARATLDAQQQLIDPIWGGVYQYSTDGDWKHPHFEKIMQMQAENLRTYAQCYALWKKSSYLDAAEKIRRYLDNFLKSPEGAFYTSQDADLVEGQHSANYFALSNAARRARGIPRVDQHIYARENGWALTALAILYAVTGDESALAEAIRTAEWTIANRSFGDGGFRHAAQDNGGPYLGDSASMLRAFLNLYAVTADRRWLNCAEKTAAFIEANFKGNLGYLEYVQPLAGKLPPRPEVDENVTVARTMNMLNHYTGSAHYRDMGRHALRFVSAPSVSEHHGFEVAGILLAGRELNTPPLHLTIVGRKDDPAARALFRAAIAHRVTYKRVEWWDTREGNLPNPDVQYPQFDKSAGFVRTDRSCSAPIFEPAKITEFKPKTK